MSQIYVIMGVAGSGKTTIGQAFADRLALPFYDADDFHPQANIDKMSQGSALTDIDRKPWLERLHRLIAEHRIIGSSAVLTCSALKRHYRDILRGPYTDIRFVYLDGRFDLIWQRISQRSDHFMAPTMLQSQFDSLEAPGVDEALIIPIDQPIDRVLEQLIQTVRAELN